MEQALSELEEIKRIVREASAEFDPPESSAQNTALDMGATLPDGSRSVNLGKARYAGLSTYGTVNNMGEKARERTGVKPWHDSLLFNHRYGHYGNRFSDPGEVSEDLEISNGNLKGLKDIYSRED